MDPWLHLRNFLEYLRVERRYSPHTINAYENDILGLLNFINDNYDISSTKEISGIHLRSFVVKLAETGLTNKSINRKISVIRRFCTWLLEMGHIHIDASEKLSSLKLPKRLPNFFKESEMKTLSEPLLSDDYKEVRDFTIVSIFYHTGIRRAELINLELNNLDFTNKMIKVLGKGGKERIIPLGDGICKILSRYLDVREQAISDYKKVSWFFLTVKMRKTYPKLIYNIVHNYMAVLTTSQKRSPHVLRHTFASQLLDNGAELNAIKELLGHSSLAATQVYTHNSISKLKAAYNRAHPKGQEK